MWSSEAQPGQVKSRSTLTSGRQRMSRLLGSLQWLEHYNIFMNVCVHYKHTTKSFPWYPVQYSDAMMQHHKKKPWNEISASLCAAPVAISNHPTFLASTTTEIQRQRHCHKRLHNVNLPSWQNIRLPNGATFPQNQQVALWWTAVWTPVRD